MFHAVALVSWLVGAAVPAFTLRNPLYLVLTLAAAWMVYASRRPASAAGGSWGSLVKIGLFFFALSIPFNALSNHSGRIVLFRLPGQWPIVGGAVTLEAVIAGTVTGLALFTILVVFAAFNANVDHYQLLRATPTFLFQAGVVISIAITFVPQMVLSAREIREAQRIRGHRFKGVRGLLPLVLPLLASSLERAIQLAEAMESRGFGAIHQPISRARAAWQQFGSLAALVGLLVGLVLTAYFPKVVTLGWILAGSGALGLALAFHAEGRRIRRTRYRRTHWAARDSGVLAASLLALAVVLAVRFIVPGTLAYTPYPPNSLLPPFNPLVGVGLLLLVMPAVLATRSRREVVGGTQGGSGAAGAVGDTLSCVEPSQ